MAKGVVFQHNADSLGRHFNKHWHVYYGFYSLLLLLCRPSEFSTSVLTLIHLGQNTTKESHKKVSLSVALAPSSSFTFADVLSRVDKNTFANFFWGCYCFLGPKNHCQVVVLLSLCSDLFVSSSTITKWISSPKKSMPYAKLGYFVHDLTHKEYQEYVKWNQSTKESDWIIADKL